LLSEQYRPTGTDAAEWQRWQEAQGKTVNDEEELDADLLELGL
jgi:hypothetical protein